jgi:hypothetical protein
VEDLSVTLTFTRVDSERDALVRRGRRLARLILMLMVTLTVVAALAPMRFIGQTWSEEDIFQCQASAFVGGAASAGTKAERAAMNECLAHRRDERWGPWGAFGNANDGSKYTAADD